ncbi:2136_t:CDS:2, partial [Dentiscutata erythropus]
RSFQLFKITNDNNDELMEKMKANIEALNFRNVIDLENNSNDDNSKDEVDSREISPITHHEVLNTIKVLEHYLIQQDLSDKDWLDHDQALLQLQKTIRKSRSASFKQVNLETLFQLID